MRPQTILRAVAACAAPAALTVAALVAAGAPSTDPAPARAAVGGDRPGAVAFRFRPRDPGSAPVRVRSGATGERVGRRNVHRRAQVSWYGPGLYGAPLACGGTLTTRTLGVASTSLPCGAKVTLRHGGRTVRVPVVDRGPYSGGREFDLTAATKDRLGFSGVGTVLVAA
jgi:rare lipoprotein A